MNLKAIIQIFLIPFIDFAILHTICIHAANLDPYRLNSIDTYPSSIRHIISSLRKYILGSCA